MFSNEELTFSLAKELSCTMTLCLSALAGMDMRQTKSNGDW